MELLDLMVDTPSWLPLAMTVVLLALLAFLFWSMRRNIKRIDFHENPESPRSPTD